MNLESALQTYWQEISTQAEGNEYTLYSKLLLVQHEKYVTKRYLATSTSTDTSFIDRIVEENDTDFVVVKDGVKQHVEMLLSEYGYDSIQVEEERIPQQVVVSQKRIEKIVKEHKLPPYSLFAAYHDLADNVNSEAELCDGFNFINVLFRQYKQNFTRDLQGRYSKTEPYSMRPDFESYPANYNDERKKGDILNQAYPNDWYKVIIVPRDRM